MLLFCGKCIKFALFATSDDPQDMIFYSDTHTHLYDEAFGSAEEEDRAASRAVQAGVTRMVIPDISSKERQRMLDFCRRWKGNAYPCIGLHPTELGSSWAEELDLLEGALKDCPDAVAIGECGMDLYWSKEQVAEQEEVFRTQLDLSLHTGLPVIIHARNATDRIFNILEDYRGRGLKGVFHAFSGSIETFRQLDRYGDWYVGIGGVLTFRKASIADTVSDIPLERILLETDSPYLTPVPHRGERNESAYIPFIASFLAMKKGVGIEETASVTTENAIRLFNL